LIRVKQRPILTTAQQHQRHQHVGPLRNLDPGDLVHQLRRLARAQVRRRTSEGGRRCLEGFRFRSHSSHSNSDFGSNQKSHNIKHDRKKSQVSLNLVHFLSQ
jgi:hypothetical protein